MFVPTTILDMYICAFLIGPRCSTCELLSHIEFLCIAYKYDIFHGVVCSLSDSCNAALYFVNKNLLLIKLNLQKLYRFIEPSNFRRFPSQFRVGFKQVLIYHSRNIDLVSFGLGCNHLEFIKSLMKFYANS